MVPASPVPLVLASASPARLRLLRSAGVEPRVHVSAVDEPALLTRERERYGAIDPADVVLLLARAKAEQVAEQVPGGVVLGCDSMLELDGEVHGKPTDEAEATARWQAMRGRSGALHTGHWLVDLREPDEGGTGATFGATASTTVYFAQLTDEEIADYVATGEPLRVAGGFTLDGLGGPYVSGVEGDPSNVVGLSLPLLRELLVELGVAWADLTEPRSR